MGCVVNCECRWKVSGPMKLLVQPETNMAEFCGVEVMIEEVLGGDMMCNVLKVFIDFNRLLSLLATPVRQVRGL